MKNLHSNLNLLSPTTGILVAVSGGMDSMVLLHLLSRKFDRLEAAHCNFHLRGEESDGDEGLARSFAEELNIPFHVKHFDPATDFSSGGVQEIARKLRYDWFYQLLEQRNLQFIATAHHERDQAETLLLNFIRGAGISGMSGMSATDKQLFRPLIKTSREAIEHYQQENNIPYRDDSSNESTRYRRNLIRHQLLPMMREMNPGVEHTLSRQTDLFREAHNHIDSFVGEFLATAKVIDPPRESIPISDLRNFELPLHALHTWLQPLGFSSQQVRTAAEMMDLQAGKVLETDLWQLTRDRDSLVLQKLVEPTEEVLYFNSIEELASGPFEVELTSFESIDFSDSNTAWINPDLLEFPMTLRRWKSGDRFQPLGMAGHQKISDFLTHQHLPSSEKVHQMVLCQGEQIIWVVGLRIDEKFRVSRGTVLGISTP